MFDNDEFYSRIHDLNNRAMDELNTLEHEREYEEHLEEDDYEEE